MSISPRGSILRTDEGRRTPLRGGVKRKRATFEEFSLEDSSLAYESNAQSNGDIEILEDDPEGKFIKLRNKGDKVLNIIIIIINT